MDQTLKLVLLQDLKVASKTTKLAGFPPVNTSNCLLKCKTKLKYHYWDFCNFKVFFGAFDAFNGQSEEEEERKMEGEM